MPWSITPRAMSCSSPAAPASEVVPGTEISVASPPLEALLARHPQWALAVVDFSTE